MPGAVTENALLELYEAMFAAYGERHWWPAETRFEVMVGAVLTQNTAWVNVEKAITNLKYNQVLSPEFLVDAETQQVAEWVRPSGYFNIKANRLRNLCIFLLEKGGIGGLDQLPTGQLREALLAVNGIGPETADDILLYAFQRPVFVIDAYTRRILSRLGWIQGDEPYEHLRQMFEQRLGEKVDLYGEYHALIVNHAKVSCRRNPLCSDCCLRKLCKFQSN